MFKSGIFMNIDIVDRKIIAELQCNARESVSSIADSIGMSIPAVAERIKKLQDSDIIKGYQAVLNKKKVGLDVSAFITVISESSKYFEKVVSSGRREYRYPPQSMRQQLVKAHRVHPSRNQKSDNQSKQLG